MKMMDAEAVKSRSRTAALHRQAVGIEGVLHRTAVRSGTRRPYYSMLNFFDHVGKLERIVNVSGLLVATTKKPTDAKAKHTYQYAANESVVATCTATTFFSHDMAPAAQSGKTRPARAGQKAGEPMKLTTGILFLGMVAGTAWGQNPDVIENTRNTMKAVQQKKAMDSDAALSASQGSCGQARPRRFRQTSGQPPSRRPARRFAKAAKPVALKAKSPAGHKKAQPKQQIAVENQKKPAEAKRSPPSRSIWPDGAIRLSARWSIAACWVRAAVPASAAWPSTRSTSRVW